MALRIGVDAHVAGARKTGNERFLLGLLRSLPAVCDHQIVALVPDDAAAAAVEAHAPGVAIERFAPGAPVARHIWSLGAAAAHMDVLLVQYAGPLRPTCPTVHVVHDASFLTHPGWFSPMERMWMRRLIPRSLRTAAAVVTVSEFSKGELVRETGIDPSIVTVAYDGVDPIFTPEGPEGERAILAIGTTGPRKNYRVVGDAIRELAGRGRVLPYLYAGPDDAPPEAQSLGYLSDARLAAAIRGAAMLVYPSLYEGFGLPPVEAMACGTPAIVADIPVMHEICGDAAVFVEPEDPRAWASAIVATHNDAERRRDLVLRGFEQAARYTWDACARTVVGVLEDAASR